MSYKEVELRVTLTIKGPVLCAVTGASRWGIDASFNRDVDGRPIIMASHIKGKLREAWRELKSVSNSGFTIDTNRLLGKENAERHFKPERGPLQFSTFKLAGDAPVAQEYHRIKVDSESGTADEGALLTFETPFGSGETTVWTGTITFTTENSEVNDLIDQIKQGLRWITAIGANKGIGFGRLENVQVAVANEQDLGKPKIENSSGDAMALGLVIHPAEPLLIGGLKRKGNYLESEKNISGAVLKGALAACINRKLSRPVNDPLPPDLEALPFLSKYFSSLCFQTAFPTLDGKEIKRPTVIPLSTVQAKKRFLDVALASGPKLIDNTPPTFKLDWKPPANVYSDFGFASPKMKAYTRTAIETESRRAEEEKLFTYVNICPVDEDKDKKVVWVSNITFPETISESDRQGVMNELIFVVNNWWGRLGKRDSRVEIKAVNGGIDSYSPEKGSEEDDKAIITLQADTLMLNPTGQLNDLHTLYSDFWQEISDKGLELERFFAEQKLLGGYLAYRCKQKYDEPYYPFFLTAAGSVFVLKVLKNEAKGKIDIWKRTGLPAPGWATKKYGLREERLDWQICPFVPENGFGEIKVNLQWHWQQEAK